VKLKAAGFVRDMPDDIFYVKGPMGKGLQMAQKGIHVAFCAGTGALIFLDLVAYLLIKNSFKKLSKVIPENMKQLYDDFEFHLYCSWMEKDQAIGLEIMEMLVKVNERLGMTNFKLVTRFSKVAEGEAKPPRWDQNWIEKTLMPYKGKMKKIWVSGPPVLNESFDKAFEQIGEKLGLAHHEIDIM